MTAKIKLENFKVKYLKDLKERLSAKGFDVDKYDDNVIHLLVEPNEAPENFHCDGEVTFRQAATSWVNRLKKSGVTQKDVVRALEYNFK